MAGAGRKCSSCAGNLADAAADRCEWCGAALGGIPVASPAPPIARPVAPADSGRFEDALRRLESIQRPVHNSARGCSFFVLLAVAVLVVLVLLFLSVGDPEPTDPAPPKSTPAAPSQELPPVERPSDR